MCWELNIKVQLISGRKKLMPNIMIVFYAGSSFWKAPQRLQEMMDKSKSMEKLEMESLLWDSVNIELSYFRICYV